MAQSLAITVRLKKDRKAELVHRVGGGAEVFWTGSSLEQCGPLDRQRCGGWALVLLQFLHLVNIPLTLSDDPTPLDTSELHLLDALPLPW